MQEKVKEKIYEILTAEGLLTGDQVQMIKAKETMQRAKMLKAKSPNIRHKVLYRSFLSLIDIIESLQIPSPPPGNGFLAAETLLKAMAKHLNLPFIKVDRPSEAGFGSGHQDHLQALCGETSACPH
ncbi:MAG: hypothetical protein M1508_12650 [Nitrospirae bacterium]|nr:hypothetical protein [Nitrospirota bacterium]MCL5422024.1 hypothetical protein [Nitrospirota bacterium]